ncbi:hypothetical protein JCM9534A_16650 [Catenuloplanes indicus JCM 9534]|uniref:Uncharacterized protein n=1 Tax=Catenuloplanes indicus TaxID=137267 RepID=A0AAE4AYG5_9ACTN|nr:hypothetical protein [Catenuloplanes indicus]
MWSGLDGATSQVVAVRVTAVEPSGDHPGPVRQRPARSHVWCGNDAGPDRAMTTTPDRRTAGASSYSLGLHGADDGP